jgi:hypothetical protein
MQVRFATNLTSEQYISQEAWQKATLQECPLHGQRRCGIRAHGSYVRKAPGGLRIGRFYCRKGHTTFSLLPDFAAARLSGTLAEVEQAVQLAQCGPTLTAAAVQLRPELNDPRSAVRWLRRRLRAIESSLVALVTVLPQLFGTRPRLVDVRARLGVEGIELLQRLRAVGAQVLHHLQAPLGFAPRPQMVKGGERRVQHNVGPDPGADQS